MKKLLNLIEKRIPLKGLSLLMIPLMTLAFMPRGDISVNVGIGQELRLPILMYHQLTKEPNRVCDYCISVNQFKNDLDELTKMGYTTVSMAEVIAFCELGTPLPPNPIVLSFDDGYEAFYTYAYPLLKERGMKAVMAVIGEEAERFTKTEDHRLKYSYSPWEQLKEMANSGFVEIVSHSWGLHKKNKGRFGAKKKSGESIDDYRKLLTEDVEKMRMEFKNNGLPDFSVYVYPFGEYSSESPEILSSLGIKAMFVCDARVNILRAGDSKALTRLKRYIRLPGETSFDGQLLPAV